VSAEHPTHGFTRHGLPLHARTLDHLPTHNAYARFNKQVALWLVLGVGSMTCFWIFFLACLTVLPSVFQQMGLHLAFPHFMKSFGFELLTTWLFSTCFQLILLPGLMVGQNLQNQAADARASKQFEDTEVIVDRLNTATQGGITDVLDAVNEVKALLAAKK
jgi:hypothetical protein